MAVSLVAANLGTVSAEAFLYGIFFMLSVASSYLLVRRERMRSSRITLLGLIRNPMVWFSVLMIIAVTTHWILVVEQSFLAFLYFDDGAAALLEYADYALWPWLARICLLDFTLALFDAVMVFRVWVVWSHSFLPIALPALFYSGEIACSIGQIYSLSTYTVGEPLAAVDAWVISGAALTLATNFSCAVLISWKLIGSHSRAKSIGTSLLSVLAIIIESAAIYVVWTAIFLANYVVFTNVRDPLLDLWAPIAGIAFMLINVRVGAGWGMHNSYPGSSGSSGSTTRFTAHVQVQRENMVELGNVHEFASTATKLSEHGSDSVKIPTRTLTKSLDDARADMV